jgi:hypothetical protein
VDLATIPVPGGTPARDLISILLAVSALFEMPQILKPDQLWSQRKWKFSGFA